MLVVGFDNRGHKHPILHNEFFLNIMQILLDIILQFIQCHLHTN